MAFWQEKSSIFQMIFLNEDEQYFEDVYHRYGLYSFVEHGLTTKNHLRGLYERSPNCIEALKEIPVVIALGVHTEGFGPKYNINIGELEGLRPETLRRVMSCRTSDEVVDLVKKERRFGARWTPRQRP